MKGRTDRSGGSSNTVKTVSCPSLFGDREVAEGRMHPMTGGKIVRRTDTDNKAVAALERLTCEKPFAKVTVTDVCREAGISRSTFYQRYGTTDGLLELTITRTFNRVETSGKNLHIVRWDNFNSGEPLCLYVRNHPELHGIFYDPDIREKIVEYVLSHYYEDNWNVMSEYGDMDREDYKSVQEYQLYGCLCMMSANKDATDRKWMRIKDAIDNVIRLHLRDHVI